MVVQEQFCAQADLVLAELFVYSVYRGRGALKFIDEEVERLADHLQTSLISSCHGAGTTDHGAAWLDLLFWRQWK